MTRAARLLGVLALVAAGCGLPLVPEESPASADFPLGVASGDATASGALVWTRYAGRGTLRLEAWQRDEPADRRVVEVALRDHGIALVPLEGLAPGRWWHYAFVALENGVEVARSDEGRFRTAPAPGSRPPLRFGATSCSNQRYPLDTLARAATEFELDAFLHLGDAVYADGAKDLAGYRAKWAGALTRQPTRLLRGSTSLVSTWDDHEIRNNAAGDRVDPAQLEAARQATFEHQPWRADAAMPGRVWRSLKWGETAELFVLDCRGERNAASGEYVSREQLDWLKQGLLASTARFKLVLNSVPMTAYPGALFALTADDRWEGWPAQRTELLSFIEAQGIPGVVWLTGDFHMGVAGRVSREGPGTTQLEFAVGPAGMFSNPSPSYPAGPQFDFATARHNFGVFDLDPEQGTVRVRYFDGGDRTLFDRTYTP